MNTPNDRPPHVRSARRRRWRRSSRRRAKRPKLRRLTLPLLPTLLTLANGLCGLGAITLATAPSDHTLWVFWAGVLVFLGMICDMFDGQLARLTRQTSQFGVELDSLCDVITFGLAPVFIMLALSDVAPLRFTWTIGALFALSAALRLARYNVEKHSPDETGHFKGLPTPAAAGAVASFAVAMPGLEELLDPSLPESHHVLGAKLILLTKIALPLLTLVLAALMVSRIRYPHLANQFFTGRRSFYQLVELVFALAAVMTLHELALPLLFGYYVFAPPANQLGVRTWLRLHRVQDERDPLPAGNP